MRLTQAERNILLHRLDVPDAIEEVLADAGHDADAIGKAIESLRDLLLEGPEVDLPDTLTEAERAVLIECCEGSTYADSGIGTAPRSWVTLMRDKTDALLERIEAIAVGVA